MMANAHIKRPVGVTLLACLTFLAGIWNGLRLSEAIIFYNILREYRARPAYIAVSGGFWLIIWLALTWGLWQGKTWSRVATAMAVTGYGTWYWFDRLILQVPRSNWPFSLFFTFALIACVAIVLFSRSTIRFFRLKGAHERKSENQTSA